MTRRMDDRSTANSISDKLERLNRFGTSAALLLCCCLLGCGRVIACKATEQLLAGDAVDRSIAQVDFRLLTGKKVFLDTQYVNKAVPGVGFVTSEYIISSIRQKMMCDGCLLEEKMDEADFVVEMRIGALGADGHEVIYGLPPNNYLGLAASVVQTPSAAVQALPTIPELSVAKKNDQMAAAKIGLFAYNRRTREPIWQSGLSEARSTIDDRWYFGAGPFQKGNIHTRKQPDPPLFDSSSQEDNTRPDYFVERRFADPTKSLADTPAGKPAVAGATPDPSKPANSASAATTPATASATTPAAGSAVATGVPAPAPTAPGSSASQSSTTSTAAPTASTGSTGATGASKNSVPTKSDHSVTATSGPVQAATTSPGAPAGPPNQSILISGGAAAL